MLKSGSRGTCDAISTGIRDLLIDVAEEQFAACGLTGASLREISRIAGCSNTGAVRYHFGDREGLIDAVFRARLARVEHERALLIDDESASGAALDLHRCLEMLFRPVERQRGRSGKRSYAAFLAGLLHFGELAVWAIHSGELPATAAIMGHLRRLAPHIPEADMGHRLALVSVLVWSGLAAIDRREPGARRDDEAEFQQLVAMAAAALAAR